MTPNFFYRRPGFIYRKTALFSYLTRINFILPSSWLLSIVHCLGGVVWLINQDPNPDKWNGVELLKQLSVCWPERKKRRKFRCVCKLKSCIRSFKWKNLNDISQWHINKLILYNNIIIYHVVLAKLGWFIYSIYKVDAQLVWISY